MQELQAARGGWAYNTSWAYNTYYTVYIAPPQTIIITQRTKGELICLSRLLGWVPGVPSCGRGEEGREEGRRDSEDVRGILIGMGPSPIPQFHCSEGVGGM